MKSLTTAFSALSDATRLSILEHLMEQGEKPAGDLVTGSGMTAPAISRHLKILRQAGLIDQRVDGTRRLYAVRPDALRAIADWTLNRRAFWENGLDRLEAAILRDEDPTND